MKKLLSLLLTLILLLPGFAAAETSQPGDAVWVLVSEAYAYAFPLVLTHATMLSATNTEAPVAGRAPINQFIHARNLANAQFRTVVTPNVDTVYTQAWLDLSEEPLVYVMPEADRFFNVQLLDAWTNTVAVLDAPGVYALALPGWAGELPDGITRVDVPTATAWFIARIVLSGEDDLPGVYAIQEQMRLLPLSAYARGGEYTAPAGEYAEENNFVPVQKVLSMGPKAFFDTANALMADNPPAAEDAPVLARLAAIGVGPGMTFDTGVLTGDIASGWAQMLKDLRASLQAQSSRYAVRLGQWAYYDAPIGDFGTEYTYRAMVALVGLGANTVDVAIYPKTGVDETGAPLTGEKRYALHFDTLPPTCEGGFWSVTAYGSADFLIDNAIDRYCINDRSAFILNEYGTLDILLSAEQPDDIANWLPVSDDEFHLFMRIYLPDWEALEGWQPPVIRVLD